MKVEAIVATSSSPSSTGARDLAAVVRNSEGPGRLRDDEWTSMWHTRVQSTRRRVHSMGLDAPGAGVGRTDRASCGSGAGARSDYFASLQIAPPPSAQ